MDEVARVHVDQAAREAAAALDDQRERIVGAARVLDLEHRVVAGRQHRREDVVGIVVDQRDEPCGDRAERALVAVLGVEERHRVGVGAPVDR